MNPAKPLRPLLPRFAALTLLLVTVFLSTGCDRIHLRRDVRRIMESRIVLPQEVSVAQGGEVYPMPDSVRYKPKMIVYVDSTECTMCRISRFEQKYDSLYRLSDENGRFSLVLLVCSGEIEGMPVSRVIADFEFGIPVYVDEHNRFLKDNPSLPASDIRLHSLFVDGEGKPIFVGNPSGNDRIRKLLDKYLSSPNLLKIEY